MEISRNGSKYLAGLLGIAAVSATLVALSPPAAKAALNTFSGLQTQVCAPGSTRSAGNSCGESTILRSYPLATAAEKNFLANLINVETETFQEFNPPAGTTGTNAAGASLQFNGAGGVTGTINPTANVTLNRVTYGNTLQSENGGDLGGGQYGIAPNSQCVIQTAVNVSPTDPGCLNTQQQVPFVNPNNPGPNPQNFLRGAATTASATNFSITFDAPISAFGFYAVDLGDFNATIALTLFGGNRPTLGTQISAFNPSLPTTCGKTFPGGGTGANSSLDNQVYNNCNGAVLFFGVVATGIETFNRVEFSIPGGTAGSQDGFAIDNITVGSRENVIPAPLPAAGLLPLGVALRRLSRKRKQLLATN